MDEDLRRKNRISDQISEENGDEVKENILRLIKGDNSSFIFFDNFFCLPQGKSLSSAKNINQILAFVLKSFYQNQLPELSYRALVVINHLIQIDNDIIHDEFMPFLLNDEFIQCSISFFSNPNKNLSILSLKTLNLLIDSVSLTKNDYSYLFKCLNFGYLNKIPEILNFSGVNPNDPEIEKICLETVVESIIPISKRNIMQCNPFIFQLSYNFIMSDNYRMNSYGLEILKHMIEHNFKFEVDQNLFQKILYFADYAPKYVLNDLFDLISSNYFPNDIQFLDLLGQNNFYLKLINRIEIDSSISSYIFLFLDAIKYKPSSEDQVIIKLIQITQKGKFNNKIESIRYLSSLTSDDMPNQFYIFLSNNGILLLLSEMIDNKVEIMDDLIKMAYKIINSIVASGADLTSFPGSFEIYESLQQILGEYDEYYDEMIEKTIQCFPNQ